MRSIRWFDGTLKKYSLSSRLCRVVYGGAETEYLRNIVPMCSLSSNVARFIPAQLLISINTLTGPYFRGPVLKARLIVLIMFVSLNQRSGRNFVGFEKTIGS